MKKLRLVMFEECNRSCSGCCNNDWDLDRLPEARSFHEYDVVMLTGGEPMLKPELVLYVADRIRKESNALVYMYTAMAQKPWEIMAALHWLDGITLTLHEQSDVDLFGKLNCMLIRFTEERGIKKSLRLNVFKNVDISKYDTRIWKVKSHIEWIKDCPLPEDEVIKNL